MIKFVCGCGKHLRARDDMAARRTVCPQCGSPVGVPSQTPHHAGADGPLSPAERLRQSAYRGGVAPRREASDVPSAKDQLIDEHLLAMMAGEVPASPSPRPSRHRAQRNLEESWSECLLFPLHAARLCAGLAIFLTALCIAVAEILPHLLVEEPANHGVMVYLCLGGLLLAGLPCYFFDSVLCSAAVGKWGELVGSPGTELEFAL